MKKSLFAALMVLSGLASALEVGVNAGGVSGKNAGGLTGITVGEHFDKFSVDAGYASAWQHNNTSNRWSLVGGYDVVEVAGVTITPKLGYVYLDNSSTNATNRTPSASAYLVGVGASMPITKEVAVTADYAYQASRNRNNEGNVLTAGVKYSF
jgi:outer membrane autotransporter protein